MNARRKGQIAAAFAALVAFGSAGWAAHVSSIPELRVYDGYWMMLGAALAFSLVAPLIWRWPRERSLVAVAIATVIGCMVPLSISAMRHHLPLLARFRGAWILGGADAVGPLLVLGFLFLWFAIREHGIERSRADVGK
jgi:hypothetical protein